MKKLIIRFIVTIVVVVILAALAAHLLLDGIIKRGIETIGPKLTKVDIKLQSVSLSFLSGSGKITGLVVGNPEGYKTPSAISVGSASLALKPGSLLSDKIVISSINVQAPEITFETDLKGNNLNKILANLDAATGGSGSQPPKAKEPAQPKAAKAGKKLQVDDFVISGGKVHVSMTTLGGKAATIPLPDIHLTDLGKGPEGITPAELTKVVLQAIEKSAVQAASGAVGDIGKGATALTKDLSKTVSGSAGSITKGIGGLFKKQ